METSIHLPAYFLHALGNSSANTIKSVTLVGGVTYKIVALFLWSCTIGNSVNTRRIFFRSNFSAGSWLARLDGLVASDKMCQTSLGLPDIFCFLVTQLSTGNRNKICWISQGRTQWPKQCVQEAISSLLGDNYCCLFSVSHFHILRHTLPFWIQHVVI